MTAAIPIAEPRLPRGDLVALVENDIGELASFIAAQSGRSMELVQSHLRWFWLENPAREPQQPLGFALRSGDRIVGCILCSPQAFRAGKTRILFMGSSCFYVDEQHRGQGGRIFLQYSRLGKQWPLFGTSANAQAATLWKAVGARPIPWSDGELFGVLHWPPVAEEFMHRRASSHRITNIGVGVISSIAEGFFQPKIDERQGGTLELLSTVEEAGDLVLRHSSEKLTAARDLPYLRWRYFSGRDESTQAFRFRSSESKRDLLVTVNRRTRGYRGQIRTLNVLDVYPEVAAAEWLWIVAALIMRFRHLVDAVVLRSLDPERQKLFSEKGFRSRLFEAPNGWFLDKAEHLNTQEWYPMPADGDGLI